MRYSRFPRGRILTGLRKSAVRILTGLRKSAVFQILTGLRKSAVFQILKGSEGKCCIPDSQGSQGNSESKVSPSPKSDSKKFPTSQNGQVHSRSLKVVGPLLRKLEINLCFTAKLKKWIQILKNVALDKKMSSPPPEFQPRRTRIERARELSMFSREPVCKGLSLSQLSQNCH